MLPTGVQPTPDSPRMNKLRGYPVIVHDTVDCTLECMDQVMSQDYPEISVP